MATATVSPGQSIDFGTLDLSDGSTDSPTDTSIRRTIDTDNFHDFFGTDFTYDGDGNITGGTLTGITDTFGGTTRLTVTGLSVPATDLQAYFDGHDTAAFLADIFGGDDSVAGADLADSIAGFAGDDTLDGGGGNDTMAGGTGNDTYIVDSAGDRVDETGGDGIDTVQSSVSFNLTEDGTTVIGAVENLTLTGSADIAGTGNALNNVITGNSGNNTLDGGAGADTMAAGAGNDTYVVDNAGDVVDETGGSGTDTVQSAVSFNLTANGTTVIGAIENLVLT